MANSAIKAYFQKAYGTKYPSIPGNSGRFGGYQFGPQFHTYYMQNFSDRSLRSVSNNTYFIAAAQTSLPKVDSQLMIDMFKQYMNFGYYTVQVGKMMLRKFAETAARYSPPNMGKANIQNKYYYRPVYKLEQLAKGLIRTEKGRVLHATREDYAALRAGMKFKVVNTKHGTKKGVAFAYTKGINEAKRLSRIENRGLTKYSWGSIINTFMKKDLMALNRPTKFEALSWDKSKESLVPLSRRALYTTDLPPIFERLRQKSPNIAKYRWGNVRTNVSNSGTKIQFRIQNNLAEVQSYCRIAIERGTNAAINEVNKLVKYIKDDAVDKIDKFFKFDVFRVTQVAALTAIKERTLKNYPPLPRGRKAKK